MNRPCGPRPNKVNNALNNLPNMINNLMNGNGEGGDVRFW